MMAWRTNDLLSQYLPAEPEESHEKTSVRTVSITAATENVHLQVTCQQYYCIIQLALYIIFLKSQVEEKLDIAKKNKTFKAEAAN